MLKQYQNKETNKALTDLLNLFYDDVTVTVRSSREEYLKGLPAGSRVPESGKIYGDAFQREFKNRCASYIAKCESILNPVLDELNEKMTEAPDADAVNVIGLLNMRSHVSKEEIADLIDRYGNNPQAYAAIADIALRHEIMLDRDPHIECIEGISSLKRSLENAFTPAAVERGHASEAFLSMLKMGIDDNFPIPAE